MAKIIDSWAIIAFLTDEPSASQMEQILLEAIEARTRLLMTSVNLGEVWYSIARAKSDAAADKAISQIRSLGIETIPADWKLAYLAAKFKAKGQIAYADCFAAALAAIEGGKLVTGDLEFVQLEDQINILWIGK